MTIIAAVRTGSAAVLATDSKVTAPTVVGVNDDGSPQFIPQTYDHAVKIAVDGSNHAVCAFAGSVLIGPQNVADYFSRLDLALLGLEPDVQDGGVAVLAHNMVEARNAFFDERKVPVAERPSTQLILVAPPAGATAPRAWRLVLEGDSAATSEILKGPGAWLEGTYGLAFALLYGIEAGQLDAMRAQLAAVDEETFQKAREVATRSAPIRHINFWAMPVQDAINLAAFLVRVQSEMEKFLPGLPACGGAIDVVTVEMAPTARIRAFPGKTLHHPEDRPR